MPRVANVRLASRVIWALEDIDQAVQKAMDLLQLAQNRAELKCDDPALLLALARVRNELADIRVLAVAARGGEYAGRRGVIYAGEEDE